MRNLLVSTVNKCMYFFLWFWGVLHGGRETNSKAKGLSLREFLKLSIKENIQDFNVFGDSDLWMEFMNSRKRIININWIGINIHFKLLAGYFNYLQIIHIFREQNKYEDSLSKEGLLLSEGSIILTKSKDMVTQIIVKNLD